MRVWTADSAGQAQLQVWPDRGNWAGKDLEVEAAPVFEAVADREHQAWREPVAQALGSLVVQSQAQAQALRARVRHCPWLLAQCWSARAEA